MCTRTADGANERLVLHVRIRCGALSITFDVPMALHEQVSLTAVIHILCDS